MFIGFVLILAGILLLLNHLHIIPGDFWDYIWSILLVALGLDMVFKRRKSK